MLRSGNRVYETGTIYALCDLYKLSHKFKKVLRTVIYQGCADQFSSIAGILNPVDNDLQLTNLVYSINPSIT